MVVPHVTPSQAHIRLELPDRPIGRVVLPRQIGEPGNVIYSTQIDLDLVWVWRICRCPLGGPERCGFPIDRVYGTIIIGQFLACPRSEYLDCLVE